MKRTHALLIALALAIAVVAGAFATLRSRQLAASSTQRVADAQVAAQTRALDRAEATLRAELRRRPPALPASGTGAAPAAAPQTVVYRRPAPIVRVVHRHSGEREQEREARGGGLDD